MASPRQSAAEEGAARFEVLVNQPQHVHLRLCLSDANDASISEATLRSPENRYEVVEGYPHPYVCLDGVFTRTRARGRGYATQLINLLLLEASRQGWAVFCRPAPYGRGKGTPERLFQFYRRLGWRTDPHRMLIDDWLVWLPGAQDRNQGAYIRE